MEKLYPILEAVRLFNIPRSVMVTAVANGVIETTCKFEPVGNRQRAKHFVTEAAALKLLRDYQDGEEERQAQVERVEAGRKVAKPVDGYSHEARSKLEDRLLMKELESYGVSAGDLL